MDETFTNTSLDDFVIKDKDYRLNKLKKNIKIFVIIISILVVIGGLTYFIFKMLTKTYGEITCIYQTYKDNETIELINLDYENMEFYLKIGLEKFEQKNKHTFKNAGNHTVTFVFKKKLNSLNNLFKEKFALIEADLSQLEADEITSLQRVFFDCINLKKVIFDFEESNQIVDMSNLFHNCSSLKKVLFNFNTE